MINLIFKCISTTSLAIMFNQQWTFYFQPTRGIRQTDPLSPLLFLICMKSFSCLIQKGVWEGWWKPFKLWNSGIQITHLMFVDDILIFLRDTNAGLLGLSKLLDLFQNATGQSINLSKSKILFSRGVHPFFKQNICFKFGVREFNKTDFYLGLSLVMDRKIHLFWFSS